MTCSNGRFCQNVSTPPHPSLSAVLRTLSFSTIAAVPSDGDASKLSIESSRCTDPSVIRAFFAFSHNEVGVCVRRVVPAERGSRQRSCSSTRRIVLRVCQVRRITSDLLLYVLAMASKSVYELAHMFSRCRYSYERRGSCSKACLTCHGCSCNVSIQECLSVLKDGEDIQVQAAGGDVCLVSIQNSDFTATMFCR